MSTNESRDAFDLARVHLRFGWWSLLGFSAFGLVLEALHGFKIDAYLSASNETRRLMWTLAHAHGTLLAVINVLFAITVRLFPEMTPASRRLASRCLLLASVGVPVGFLAGGVLVYEGDPNLGILVLPLGAALLLIALFVLASTGGSPAIDR